MYPREGSCAVLRVCPKLPWWHHGLLQDLGKSFKAFWGSVQMATGCGLEDEMQQMWIFKSEVHYLGYLVATHGVQPLPEKVATIQALELPRNIEELWYFLGLVRFYRKFILFFANITACLNSMLWKGTVFKWTEECNNAFNLLKSDLVKNTDYSIQIPINHLNYLRAHLSTAIWVYCIKRRYMTN